MKRIHKLTSLAITAALVLSGCAENKAPASGEATTDTKASVTTTSTEETTEIVEISTTAAESDSDTTQPRNPDERLALSLEADQSGTGSEMEFARVYKLKNTSSETIEDMHDKLLDFEEFDEAQQLVLVFDNNDTVVVEWNNGNPEWENATRYFNSGSEFDDNVLPAGAELSITAYNFGEEAAYFTVMGTDAEETTASTSAVTTSTTTTTTKSNVIVDAINDETLPDPVMDESIFTLYIGGGETCEKYDVKVDALPADILKTVVKEAQGGEVTIAVDRDGKYSLADPEELEMLPILVDTERMLSREAFEDIKQYLADSEYADMTYEKYRSLMLNSLEMAYPGISERFDENGHLKETDSNGDKTELFYLDSTERAKFLEEMTIVAEAVSKAFGAEKINYELLGMGDAHLHWHLFPRVSGDIENYGNNGRGPVWWYPMEKMYSDDNRPSQEQLTEMKSKLLAELEKIYGTN